MERDMEGAWAESRSLSCTTDRDGSSGGLQSLNGRTLDDLRTMVADLEKLENDLP